jgi:hypothetical protein
LDSNDHTFAFDTLNAAPSFVGKKVVVNAQSVWGFHEACLRTLAELIGPSCPLTQDVSVIILSVDTEGIMQLDGTAARGFFARYTAREDDRVYRAEQKNGATELAVVKSAPTGSDRSAATTWSGGRSVYWVLSACSQFFSSKPLSVHCNHDFDLYDLPDGYLAIMELGQSRASFREFQCEAFKCKVLVQKRKTRHGEKIDALMLAPPTPLRALARPTDIGFDAGKNTVDVRSARRFVTEVLVAYAPMVRSKDRQKWADPLRAGTWDEICGKLVWLLLQLDEDDLHKCAFYKVFNNAGVGEGSSAFQDEHLIILLLHAPWFITANTVDALQGKCVTLGSTIGGRSAWWDDSFGQWKSQLGVRAFRGVHIESAQYECGNECDVVKMVRDCHVPEDFDSAAHVTRECVDITGHTRLMCDGCGRVYKDQSHNVFLTCGATQKSKKRVVCTQNDCPQPPLRSIGYRLQGKCNSPGCAWKTRKVKIECDCSIGEDLACKQARTTKHLVRELQVYTQGIQKRVKNPRPVRLLVRPKLDGETETEHEAYKKSRRDSLINRYKHVSRSIIVSCRVSNDPTLAEAESDVTEDSESEMDDLSALGGAREIEDSYATMVMNTRWRVVRFTRDAVVLAFDSSLRPHIVSCDKCSKGLCELWKDGRYHCVACKTYMVSDERAHDTFPWKSVASVNVNRGKPADVLVSYSEQGRDVQRHEFIENYLRNMTRVFF